MLLGHSCHIQLDYTAANSTWVYLRCKVQSLEWEWNLQPQAPEASGLVTRPPRPKISVFRLHLNFAILFLHDDVVFQNTMLLYLLFFLCYLVLVPLQMYAVTCQHHPVTRLFTASLLLEFVGLMFNVIDVVKYSVDGIGTPNLAIAGDVLDILSRVSLFLKKILSEDSSKRKVIFSVISTTSIL